MKKQEKRILIIGVGVCILLLFVSITPLFGIDNHYYFLIIAIPTCVVVTAFGLKIRYEIFHKRK